MVKIVDARAQTCPFPVIMTKEALDECDQVVTIVDNGTARENVLNFASDQGCAVTVESKSDGTYLTITKTKTLEKPARPQQSGLVLFVASELLGRGDNESLGALLMQSFLNTLDSLTIRPETVIFINSGVKLVAGESPSVATLRRLESEGVEILACGTCLSRFALLEKVAVGQVSNMHTIADTLLRATKVLAL